MAKRYGKKKVWKTVGTIALAAVVCVGAVAGIGALVNRNDDGFEKVHVSYEIGGLDASGKYEETKATLYTKEGFDVTDMETVFADIDFNSTISYQLFYYGENDTFIESTSVLTDDYKDDVPEGALTCRVEITPIWKEDTKADDQKVTWLNNLFGYDIEHYPITHDNKLYVEDIWDVLQDYALAYTIYTIQSSLIVSNYSIRIDNLFMDLGNFPLA